MRRIFLSFIIRMSHIPKRACRGRVRMSERMQSRQQIFVFYVVILMITFLCHHIIFFPHHIRLLHITKRFPSLNVTDDMIQI